MIMVPTNYASRRNQDWFPSIFNELLNDTFTPAKQFASPAVNVLENEKEYKSQEMRPLMLVRMLIAIHVFQNFTPKILSNNGIVTRKVLECKIRFSVLQMLFHLRKNPIPPASASGTSRAIKLRGKR